MEAYDLRDVLQKEPEVLETSIGRKQAEFICAQTNRRILIVTSGIEARTAAFVRKGESALHLNENLAANDNPSISHVIKHEENHFKLPWELNFSSFPHNKACILAQHLGISPEEVLEDRFWIEGAVEAKTIGEKGIDHNVAYLHREVPVFEHLNQLFMKHTGKSFKALFIKGKEEEIVQSMLDLANILELKAQLAA